MRNSALKYYEKIGNFTNKIGKGGGGLTGIHGLFPSSPKKC